MKKIINEQRRCRRINRHVAFLFTSPSLPWSLCHSLTLSLSLSLIYSLPLSLCLSLYISISPFLSLSLSLTLCLSLYISISPFLSLSLSLLSETGAMLGTGLGIATIAMIGDSYVHTFAAFSTFTVLSLG